MNSFFEKIFIPENNDKIVDIRTMDYFYLVSEESDSDEYQQPSSQDSSTDIRPKKSKLKLVFEK
ncbi:MAG: hypothetical protein SFY32_01255 [Bacteroidota bacterium]|nr:hypothetical protein [Bacteroidota bacterium]